MENHNWAAVIPCRYLLAKDITSTQKLIIGLISSLSNLKGYCYAGNEYFAECLSISKDRISSNITDLEKKGYITRIIKRNNRKEIEQRIIKLVLENNDTLPSLTSIPALVKSNTLPPPTSIPPPVKGKENKKFNNNINNKVNRESTPTLEQVINYFLEKGSTEEKGKQAYEYYEAGNWHDAKGNKVKSWKQKMLSVWINNNNFTKTTKNETAKRTNLDYYKDAYDKSIEWAKKWDDQR